MRRILLAMTSLVCTSLIGTVACEAKANPAGSVPSRTVLEQVEGKQALEWVRAQNNRSAALLQADPRYRGFYDSVLAVEQTPGRLPLPDQAGGRVWNLWQDAAHPKGSGGSQHLRHSSRVLRSGRQSSISTHWQRRKSGTGFFREPSVWRPMHDVA